VSDVPEVLDNQAAGRFELDVDGHLAELVYKRRADRLVLVHTEVPEALAGRGIGGTLVTAAVDAAERDGLTIVAECPFAKRWLESHPDVANRVPIAST
jgi:predicted GNAT family acetyltransferase